MTQNAPGAAPRQGKAPCGEHLATTARRPRRAEVLTPLLACHTTTGRHPDGALRWVLKERRGVMTPLNVRPHPGPLPQERRPEAWNRKPVGPSLRRELEGEGRGPGSCWRNLREVVRGG